jgi:hypothetical protein
VFFDGQAMLFLLEEGDEVAVLPEFGATPAQTLEIAPIIRVWRALITLPGNRIYHRADGTPFAQKNIGYIVPATPAHRSVATRNAAAVRSE